MFPEIIRNVQRVQEKAVICRGCKTVKISRSKNLGEEYIFLIFMQDVLINALIDECDFLFRFRLLKFLLIYCLQFDRNLPSVNFILFNIYVGINGEEKFKIIPFALVLLKECQLLKIGIVTEFIKMDNVLLALLAHGRLGHQSGTVMPI